MWKTKSKAESLIEELKLKRDKIDSKKLKFYFFQQDKDFWEEFEELLRDNRKTTGKYRISFTLKKLGKWKKEWVQSKNFSPKKIKNKSSKEDLNRELGQKPGQILLNFNQENFSSLSAEKSFGPFIYDFRHNQLWYQNQLLKWESRSQMGGDWFGNQEIKIYIQRLDNWNISVHAKIGLLTYKAHFSCFKTEKITLFFQPWNEVYKTEEGKWERKLTSEENQQVQQFFSKYQLESKETKFEEVKRRISQLTLAERENLRKRLEELEKKKKFK